MTIAAARHVRRFGLEPKIALCSHSQFGNLETDSGRRVRGALAILDAQALDFAYEGEMHSDAALDPELRARIFPDARFEGPANVLIMPGLHTSNAAHQIMEKLGGGTVIGPLLAGLARPAQIVHLGASVGEIVNVAALTAYESQRKR